ncbi:hypothetical protein CEXT_297421 [Caerostris extrusa]|uniref:Uncharacterized protein n=1 Tax=Caerostris extrusa TaxID=172846 RepID=A0AAV4MEM1_CAEEX|nr:hypothetical protein CEXT_297421 [Caerostris extrusa]
MGISGCLVFQRISRQICCLSSPSHPSSTKGTVKYLGELRPYFNAPEEKKSSGSHASGQGGGLSLSAEHGKRSQSGWKKYERLFSRIEEKGRFLLARPSDGNFGHGLSEELLRGLHVVWEKKTFFSMTHSLT